MSSKLVLGVGVNDKKYLTQVRGKTFREYWLWKGILNRCYCAKTQQKYPTYIGCSVSENFKNYSFFHEWCQNQIGFARKDFHLDKDLIQKGNKLYSETTCLFLPRELNNLLTSRKVARGVLPLGVSLVEGRFMAQCHRKPIQAYIGCFGTPEEAHNAYKHAKETYIKL